MARNRKNNTRRREANRRLPPNNFSLDLLASLNAPRAFKNQTLASPTRAAKNTRWEPSSKLKTYLKNTSQLRSASQQVITPSTPKTKPYVQPNWSDVTKKKIEQPSAVRKSLCDQRAERKQILFAKGKAGQAGQKTPVWTELSRKKCK